MKQIPLSQGKFALVDDDDYERIIQIGRWCVARRYAVRVEKKGYRKQKQHTVYMHRIILNAQKGTQIDHVNGNGLDNRKCNLRICTPLENSRNKGVSKNNKSGFKGVSWFKLNGKWRAYIDVDGKKVYLGFFNCSIKAAKAYNEAAVKYFGEFARLNEIP